MLLRRLSPVCTLLVAMACHTSKTTQGLDDTSVVPNPDTDSGDSGDTDSGDTDSGDTDSAGPEDNDGDGSPSGEDCDDANPAVYPGATEVCDGVDNDCNDLVDDDPADPSSWYADGDGDGYGDASMPLSACEAPEGYVADATDCDDTSASWHPGADESDCTDPNDYNCDGSVGYADADGDGTVACEDCDDGAAAVHPGATEICDDADTDEDCNGAADDADAGVDPATLSTWHPDADLDTWGDANTALQACDAPAGAYADGSDCDDANALVNPGADEVCNDIDDDCDALVDDADPSLDTSTTSAWYADGDGDGYGTGTATDACAAPAGDVADTGDCDDSSTLYHPGADESDCTDPNDYNCDGTVGYVDGDGDGWAACEDCDDGAAGVNPGATEICDDLDVDEDCDGLADDADDTVDPATESAWYTDGDGDRYGDAGAGTMACSAPAGTVSDATDCDDAASAVNPAASEVCNGVDDDCDALTDDADPSLDTSTGDGWYTDGDGDGYGAGTAALACVAPAGTVADGTDCDDAVGAVNPAASEVCDGIDNDCDRAVDDADSSLDASSTSIWYTDGDGDGFGGGSALAACAAPAGTVTNTEDCDDGDPAINPDAVEVCDAANTDEDCNGAADDADPGVDSSTQTSAYPDADGDGYGAMIGSLYCDAPATSTTDHSDCDDGSAAAHPGGTEVCDDLDNDCDGAIDWGHRVPSDSPTIQAAIDAAADGDTVCVEAGTYAETIDLGGKALALTGTSGSALTTIDGGGTGPVLTIAAGEGPDTVVTGFTVTGGAADTGAGVYVYGASPTLGDLVVTGNTCDAANCYGTGLYAAYGDPSLDGVSVSGNSSTATTYVYGGGAWFSYASPTVVDSQFNANSVTCSGSVYGTGLSIFADNGTSASFRDVTVDENITTLTDSTYGNQYGSLYVYYAGPTFDGLSVSANEGYDGYNVWSPAVTEYYSSASWTNVEMNGNVADTYYADSAGLRTMASSSRWSNTIIAGNEAVATFTILSAGAFIDRGSTSTFTNVDLALNNADGAGTAYIWTSGLGEYGNGYTIAFDNANVVGNTVTNAGSNSASGVYSTGYLSFAYSNVYGNDSVNFYGMTDPTGTGGDFSADPLYVDTSAADPRSWDLHLGAGSPAIDAGDPAILDTDGSTSDVGAYGG